MSEQFIFFPNYEKNREFLLRIRCQANPTPPPRPGEAPHPPPLPENLPLGLHRKLPLCAPASHPGVSEFRKPPRNSWHTPLGIPGRFSCKDRPWSWMQGSTHAVLSLFLPTLLPFSFWKPITTQA